MNAKSAFVFVCCFLVLGVAFLNIKRAELLKRNKEYFTKLDLTLTGIVTDKQEVYSNRGLIYLDIRSTTIPEYDVRSSESLYYCVIHKNKAELLEGYMSEIHVGDSIVVNSRIDSIKCFRNNDLIFKNRLYVTDFDCFYRDVFKYYRF